MLNFPPKKAILYTKAIGFKLYLINKKCKLILGFLSANVL